jgi:hypothetical protein
MAFLSFKHTYDGRLVVVSYEGPGRLLLNGNRTHNERARRNAAAHPETVCWIELTPGGGRVAQGVGPAASHLDKTEVERLLRELPQTSCCRSVLEHLDQGRDHAGRWLELTRGHPRDQGSPQARPASRPAGKPLPG